MEAAEFMAEDSLFVFLGTIFAIYMAIRAWTKGAMSFFWALASWGAGIAAGWWVFHHGLGILEHYTDITADGNKRMIASGGLAVVIFSLVRLLTKAVFNKVFSRESFLGSWMYGGGGAVLSLIPTGVILIVIALLIRMTGTMWELNEIDKISARGGQWTDRTYPSTIAIVRWRNSVEGLPQGQRILDMFDPFGTVARRNLAELLLACYSTALFEDLKAHPPTAEVANHPVVADLLQDEEISEIVSGTREHDKYFDLLLHPRLKRDLREYPDLSKELQELDMADEIRVISTGEREKKRLPWLKRLFE